MRLLIKLVISAVAVWVAVQLVPGLDFTGDLPALLLIAIVLALVNAIARPIVTVLSLPLVILSLGLFLLVINALMFALVIWVSGEFDLGLTSSGFGATFLGALVVTIVSWIGEALLNRD